MFRAFIILLLMTSSSFAQNARAILEVKDKVENLKIGETYFFKLTIVPFSVEALDKETFLSKTFIDYFYVTNVDEIYVSKNNQEAIIVEMRAVVVKKFQPKALYIWNLIDRNIPVELKISSTEDTKLQIKEFVVKDTGSFYRPQAYQFWILAGVLIFILLVSIKPIKQRWFRKPNQRDESAQIKKRMFEATSHEDFEFIYEHRKQLLHYFSEKENFEEEFSSLLELYRIEQFSTSWGGRDLKEIIASKDRLVEGIKDGV